MKKKRTSMRTCKHMDGDIKCTKYAQWKNGNKGCYCHKHFRMMEQNNLSMWLRDCYDGGKY